jgi:hypothetical protein
MFNEPRLSGELAVRAAVLMQAIADLVHPDNGMRWRARRCGSR